MKTKSEDNVETKKLIPLIKDFLEKLDNNHDGHQTIKEFEWKSRDGFIAHSHNHGGMDLISITNDGYLIGSGQHFGISIEGKVNESHENAIKQVREDYPELEDNSEEFYEKLDNILTDDYSGQAFRVRVMYEGNNTLVVYAGWDNDAPYFRWYNEPEFEKTIKFKNKRDLKTKLNKLLKKINKLN